MKVCLSLLIFLLILVSSHGVAAEQANTGLVDQTPVEK